MTRRMAPLTLALCLLCALPARGQSIAELLRRSGQKAEQFTRQLSLVRCLEQDEQLKMNPKGKVMWRLSSEYDYVNIVQVLEGSANVEESRVRKGGKAADADTPQFVTQGFATLILIFHPEFQDSFTFTESREESRPGMRAIDFELKPGARSTTVFRARDRNFPVAWKGTAWIDPVNGEVQRIHAGMKDPIEDLGLQSLQATVDYALVHFAEVPEGFWLPKTAVVDLETRQQHWRNTQTYRDYSLFSVHISTGGVR